METSELRLTKLLAFWHRRLQALEDRAEILNFRSFLGREEEAEREAQLAEAAGFKPQVGGLRLGQAKSTATLRLSAIHSAVSAAGGLFNRRRWNRVTAAWPCLLRATSCFTSYFHLFPPLR